MKLLITLLGCFLFSISYCQAEKENIELLKAEKVKIENQIDSLQQRLQKIEDQLATPNPEERQKQLIEKYGKNKGKMIAMGKVWQSISYEMAEDSWGKPEKIQKTETTDGETQKWIYSDNRYLYFKNGRLESWKE